MTLPSTVAIVGLGLMGGSLARDLSPRGVRVLGYDARPEVLDEAVRLGVLAEALDTTLSGLEAAELIVLALPVDHSLAFLDRLTSLLGPQTVATDLGSTKRAIVQGAERLGLGPWFVGSHPLTGDHRSGWSAAREGLYRGAPVYLCPTPSTRADTLDRVRGLWNALDARAELLDAGEHDRRMGWVSHLPQITSSALAAALAASGHHPGDLGPGGRDAVRLAASSPEMWAAICLQNAEALEEPLQKLLEQLLSFSEGLRHADPQAMAAFFHAGRDWIR